MAMTGKRNDVENQTHLEIVVEHGNNHKGGMALPMRYCAPTIKDLSYQDRINLDGEVNHVASKVDKMGETGALELITMLAIYFAFGGGDKDPDRRFVSFYRGKFTGKMKADIDLRMVGFGNEEIYELPIDNG